jgi:hypothetical protein
MKIAVVRSLIATSIFLICVSCASDPPQEHPLKPGMAQVIMSRAGNTFFAGSASVEINGSHVIDIGNSEIYTGDIAPGPVVIATYSSIIPGRYVFKFTAEAGKIYRFRVWSRGETAGRQGSKFTVTETSGAYQVIGD